jgi:hypothetical protein
MVTEIELFESPDVTWLDFCFWCWMNCGLYRKERWKHQTNFSLALCMLLAAQNKGKFNPDGQHATFEHELQSAVKLAAGFWNIYCEL